MKISLIICLTLSSFALAHFRPNPKIYFVEYQRAEKFNQKLDYNNQSYIGEHVSFIKKLYREGFIVIGGVFQNQKFGTYFMQAESIVAVDKKLKSDPVVQNKILKYKIRPYTLTMLNKKIENKHHH